MSWVSKYAVNVFSLIKFVSMFSSWDGFIINDTSLLSTHTILLRMISSLHLEFYLNVCQGRAIVVWIKATVRGVCFRLAQVVAPTPTCQSLRWIPRWIKQRLSIFTIYTAQNHLNAHIILLKLMYKQHPSYKNKLAVSHYEPLTININIKGERFYGNTSLSSNSSY
jgi:hypothetical protein